MKGVQNNSLIFLIAYFTTNVVRICLITYIPLYFISILDVDKEQLAFTQFFGYLTLLLAPALGYYFDKHKSKIRAPILVSSVFLGGSFLAFALNSQLLAYFGIFLTFFWVSQEIIRVAIGKILTETSLNDNLKRRNVILSMGGSIFGALVVNAVYLVIKEDLYSQSSWNLFFLLIFSLLTPLFVLTSLIREPTTNVVDNSSTTGLKNAPSDNREQILGQNTIVPLVLAFASYFLIFSDRLVSFIFLPWIFQSFGEDTFSVFSTFYFVLILLNFLGAYIGRKKIKGKRVKLMVFLYSCFFVLTALSIVSNQFLLFFIVYGIAQIVNGIMLFNLTLLILNVSKFSRKSEHENARFQVLRSSYSLASVIFVPIGTIASIYLNIETIMFVVALLIATSLVPLYWCKTGDK